MNWFLLTVVSALAYATAEIISKYISDDKSEPIFTGLIAAVFTTITLFQFAVLEQMKLPTNMWAIVGLICSAALVAVGIITYFEGLKNSDVSEFSLLSRSRILIVVLGGIILFKEHFSFVQIIGAVLVFYSVFLLSWEGGKFRLGKGSKYAIITAVLFGVGFMFDKAVVSYYSAIMYTFLNYLLIAIFLLPFAIFRFSEGIKLPKKSTVGALFIVGALYGLSAYFINAAFIANGPISFMTLISQLEILITVLWGIFLMKEDKKIFLKLSSMALLILGVILLK